MPTDAEISAAEELIVVLKDFHDATEIISGEKYATIGRYMKYVIVMPCAQRISLISTQVYKCIYIS